MDDVEGVGEVSGSCVVIVWHGGCWAANFCELDLGIAYEADKREIEHAWNLDCDSLPCRGCCVVCKSVLCGRRRVKQACDQSF